VVYCVVFLDDGRDEGITGGDRGDIEGGGEVRAWIAEAECLGEGGGVDVAEGESRSQVGELDSGCAADARAGAGDDDDLVGEGGRHAG